MVHLLKGQGSKSTLTREQVVEIDNGLWNILGRCWGIEAGFPAPVSKEWATATIATVRAVRQIMRERFGAWIVDPSKDDEDDLAEG